MFDFIRTHQRLMQFLLLVLVVPSFALIGVSGYNTYVSGDHDLVKVGTGAITQQDFERARADQLRQMQERSQGGFDPDLLDTPEVKRALLDSLVDSRVTATVASRERFNVSDVQLRRSIAAMPQLQVEGQFSPERYNEVLAASGLTTRDFEQGRRYELALGRVLDPVARSAQVPAPVVQALEQALLDERGVRVQRFDDADYRTGIDIPAADVAAWYDEHKAELEVPEYADIDYLVLDEAAAMAALPEVGDAELQDYYRQNKSRFTRKARVKLSHIQVNVPAGATQEQRDQALEKAREIAALVKKGDESFADLAKAHSQDAGTARLGGELGWITQGSWPASLDKAVFSLAANEVSDIIDGPGGYHIFKASEVAPEQVESFDSVREQVTQEVRRQLGAERFADMATRLTSLLYDHPESLEPAAGELGMTLRQADGVGREALVPAAMLGSAHAAAQSDDARLLDDLRVRRAVYSSQVLREKHNSGVIEISPDTMLALRIRDVRPAHVPALERVTTLITERLLAQRAHRAAVAAGQARLAELQAQADAPPPEGFGELLSVSRMDPGGLAQPVLEAVLKTGPDQVPAYGGTETGDAFVLFQVASAGTATAETGLRDSLSGELAAIWGAAEEKAVLKALRDDAKVDFLPEADEAIQSRDGDN